MVFNIMSQNTRLPRLLHIMLHMHLKGGTTTSDTIAKMLHTNPVVVRRMMSSLKELGVVESTGGRGGGWTLVQEKFASLTVLDVYQSTQPTSLFTIRTTFDNPQCPVEKSVNQLIETELNGLEKALLDKFSNKKIIDIWNS